MKGTGAGTVRRPKRVAMGLRGSTVADAAVAARGPGPGTESRHWTVGVLVSTLTHGAVLVALASWYVATGESSHSPDAITTRWSEHEAARPEPLERFAVDVAADVRGSGVAKSWRAVARRLDVPRIRLADRPGTAERLFAEFIAWRRMEETDLTQRVADIGSLLRTGVEEGSRPAGAGAGTTAGDGRGIAFFGRSAVGQRFVYVLDCSKSMNHPYPAPAKTRFIRVKLELLKSLRQMGPEHQFFILFFNDVAIPMPARSLQAATTSNKLRFLQWVHQVRAEGGTEPTAALRAALELKPDVLFFLTDGSFQRRVQEEVAALPTGRTVVHTFAFREELPEQWRQANASIEAGKLSEARRLLGTAKYRKLLEHRSGRNLLRSLAEKTGGGFFLIP